MRAITWICRLGVIAMAASLLFGAVILAVAPRVWGIANSWEGRPLELRAFQPLARPTHVYDADGNRIASFQRQNSQPIELAKIPEPVRHAFLVVEDRDFYTHNGVNARSLVRAVLSNVASDNPQQGASTISMQVAKNEFLGGIDRDFRYKALQIHYAMMLENQYTKDQLFERYLNTVFFGNNAYGVQAAAEAYFGKTVDQITFIEAAYLAGLVRSPSGYDPIDNPERSRARFAQVVDLLVESGEMTEAEGQSTLDTFEVPARIQTRRADQPDLPRTYFTEALRDYLLNRSDILGSTFQQREAALYRGGLEIHTTLIPGFQQMAEDARDLLPETQQGFDAALVSLNTKTGAVVAMVGGRGFVPGENEVNMALAPRQTGSSQKLFILAAALQAGASPDDVIDGRRPCILPNPGEPSEPFEIRDAVSRQPDSVRAMTWYSINCAYARLAQIVGLNRVVKMTYTMAKSPYLYEGQPATDRDPLQPFPALATGANPMSPMDMAAGAQTIANEGLHMEPFYVQYIDDWRGERVYTHDDPGVQVLDRGVALQAVDVLKGVLTNGTGRRYPLNVPAAGKTGTQVNNTNAWFVGFTPQLTTAVWVGDPDAYTPMVNVPEFDQERVQGGLYPTQIWQQYMNNAHAFLPGNDWAPAPAAARPPQRLYLPGNECIYVVTGYNPTVDPNAAPPAAPGEPAGFARPEAPPTTTPAATTVPPPPPATVQAPVYGRVDSGTTIPPNVLDPRAPVNTVPLDYRVAAC
jgi:membrane peptidoglycan carboxypeptidase